MRIAKPLLMISMSVFLLAVSWSLLTGQLGLPGPAQAQTTGSLAAMLPFTTQFGAVVVALTDTGDVYRCTTNNSVTAWGSEYLGTIGQGAVPTTDQSASGL